MPGAFPAEEMKGSFAKRVNRAVASVQSVIGEMPEIGVILGSGLGGFAETVDGIEVPYSDIEGFAVPTVEGHKGSLKLGKDVAVLAGRFHLYEGWDTDDVVLPVFLLAGLGAKQVIVTNASGAINRSYRAGELVLIRDHINLMSSNPLIGPHLQMGPRFPDMSHAYSPELRGVAQRCRADGIPEGVYAALPGPSYETPAEIEMLRRLGADLVGMSTVPEVIAARFLGLEVLGISCVTNMAAGIRGEPLRHEEVIETGKQAAAEFERLLVRILISFGCDMG
jgi:purine-nucleoside phosphorylase